MRLGRRATLLVALVLLTSAATVSADCAWLLWGGAQKRRADGTLFVPVAAYLPAAGFSTKAECEEAEKGQDRKGRQWLCLPDSVDPRRPKAK